MSKESVYQAPNVLFMEEVPKAYKMALWPELTRVEGKEAVETPTGRFVYDHASKSVCEVEPNCRNDESISSKGVTVIVPMHNEAKNIETFMSNLSLAQMPKDTDIHFLFIVNGCTDDSFDKTKRALDIFTQSEAERVELDALGVNAGCDSGLAVSVLSYRFGKQRFMILETTTGSKANALNIGNKYALKRGHEMCMNLDANNFVEPGTILEVLKVTEKEVVHGDKFFVDAHPVSQRKENSVGCVEKGLSILAGVRPDKVNVHESKETSISGWCVAWSPRKLESIGGVPFKGGDDYALGVICRAMGYEDVNIHSKGRVWGFAPGLKDRIKGASRWHRERMQLIDYAQENLDPCVAQNVCEILAKERNMGKSAFGRIASLAVDIKKQPTKAHKTIARFVIQEIGSYYGRKEYRKNPLQKSWTPLKSTK